MFNFFVDKTARTEDQYTIGGTDYNHIKNVLRIQHGDTFLVSCDGSSCLCRLNDFSDDSVIADILEENYQSTELPVLF